VSEVKRWRIPKILYPCYAPVSETDEVVPAAAYDALKAEVKKVCKLRDDLITRNLLLLERTQKAEAERDKLAATVERINPWIEEAETYTPILERIVLDTGLRATLEELFRACRAEPVEERPTYYRRASQTQGGWYDCQNERATTDRRRGYEHTYQADSEFYGTKHVRYCIAGNSGPQLRTGQRRKACS
jgi:hypothetical protein